MYFADDETVLVNFTKHYPLIFNRDGHIIHPGKFNAGKK